MTRRGLALAAGLCVLGLSVFAAEPAPTPAPVQVSMRPEKTEVTVGEAFTVLVEATGPAGATFVFPAGAQSDSGELTTPSLPAGSPSPAALPPHQYRYEARVFALGEAALPTLAVRYRLPDGTEGEAEAAPLSVKVASVLPKGEEQAPLADIRPPVSLGIAREFWLALALGLLVLAGLAYVLWRRLRRPRAAGAPAPIPEASPDAEARAALAALRQADHFGRGDARGYYIALSALAKRYLERRLGAPVLEMTTAEMLAFLRESKDGEAFVGLMRDVALAADQVKFARGDALREEGERHLQAVSGLVDSLESRLRPAPTPGRTEGQAA